MERKKKTKFDKNQLLPLIFIFIFIAIGIFTFLSKADFKTIEVSDMFEAEQDNCAINYGKSECLDGKLVIPFFNPNTRSIDSIHMFFSVKSGTDIYNVEYPLAPNKTGTLTTSNCNNILNPEETILKWCCGDRCYRTVMNKPDQELYIKTY